MNPSGSSSAVEIRCLQGPDAGKSFYVGEVEVTLGTEIGIGYNDSSVGENHVSLIYTKSTLYFRTAPDRYIYVNSQHVSAGTLPDMQYFYLGQSLWQVWGVAQKSAVQGKAFLDSLAERLQELSGTDKLEGFSLSDMFSEVFKNRQPEDVEDYFLVGTSRTTPPIDQVQTGWPKPWFFARVLMFIGIVYIGFAVAADVFPNTKLWPAMMIFGSLATPMATLILFFELNTPRNVSLYTALMMLCIGGVVSIPIALLGFSISPLGWMGASEAGIVEEIGKFLTVVILVRQPRYKYILNGLFFGAAVGAGFAAFESAGYAFEAQMGGNGLEGLNASIHLRAALAPFGHVAWTAISAGAFWRVKQDKPLTASMFLDPSFLKAFCIPVVLHMIWNAPKAIQLPFHGNQILTGLVSWFVLFGLVQQGLKQVRAEQRRITQQKYDQTLAAQA